ncbi:hypothetical protein Bcav_3959 [Beutenbergia cavernae DSM 12333]|uniref:Uncharacterized protein n=1 Tax=Beutenbergia cavernae (strain ATCC BAA-8 / DSM 12333 / CCUG 43141 / JCM 11478 / NBRC 16432 / NCIMB 13614 / HKI 0122) TaxID=471853 RepID=C5C560_BEUC1|nr:hypothetical protein [Beutenbergia cavernae]ACQ82200.1 hypothetical protein Bcav_3959 [Beutenbergia cavernae DSM 12333]
MPGADLGAERGLTAPLLAIPADPVPPSQYSWWVWTIGLVLLALIAAWYVFVFRSTRPRPADGEEGRRGHDPYEALRAEYLAEVEEAYERYQGGTSDLRGLHLDYNHIMRQFASERVGVDASSLTVTELGRLEHSDSLVALLEDYQEPAFATSSDAQALTATEQAREVIRTW